MTIHEEPTRRYNPANGYETRCSKDAAKVISKIADWAVEKAMAVQLLRLV